jgi:hypothetical protein
MAAMPVLTVIGILGVILVAIWRAFFGPPPEEKDVATARIWGATAVLLYAASIYSAWEQQPVAPLFLAAGVVTLCLAFWNARGDDDDGGGGDGEPDGPLDWDEFDRLRRDWDRPRATL